MKLSTNAQHRLEVELARHAAAADAGDVDAAWQALERAHIVAQPQLGPHLRVHLLMLACALDTRDVREAIGQVARLALAPFGSLTGRLPAGNTGRSDVSALAAMPVPADLQDEPR
jgi:hypothetical protein